RRLDLHFHSSVHLLISVLGIVLNVFVLMVFCLHKKACTTPEIYLSNMAAADLVLVSFLPFWANYISNYYNWIFGEVMCKIAKMIIIMNSFCSIYFLVLVSIDRYLALVHPLSFKRIRTPFFAKLGCLLVWILGFSFGVPTFIFRKVVKNYDKNICTTVNLSYTTVFTSQSLNLAFGFIVPVSIIVFCTVKIIKILRSRPMEGVNAKKTEQKATTLVLAVLLAFLICWVPYHLLGISVLLPITECSTRKVFYICGQIFSYLAYFNSVLNPILYIIVGKNFRKKVQELFRQWKNKRFLIVSKTSTSKTLSGNRNSADSTNRTENVSSIEL
ncbi:B2 bradykinin receptor-like, partial [Austrofundulus limnaeus]|uniref:B2 bradykinin receptor-like n=1 Tax=Austrofundulus limnaeus TaxID=52670 RepID=A0A2I4C8S9_AUSLI